MCAWFPCPVVHPSDCIYPSCSISFVCQCCPLPLHCLPWCLCPHPSAHPQNTPLSLSLTRAPLHPRHRIHPALLGCYEYLKANNNRKASPAGEKEMVFSLVEFDEICKNLLMNQKTTVHREVWFSEGGSASWCTSWQPGPSPGRAQSGNNGQE